MKVTTTKGQHPIFGKMPVINIDPGNEVVCDFCNQDFTHSEESGGFLFGSSKAVGPCCAARFLLSARQYGEEHRITARCPEGKSFANWVREDLR